MTIGTARPRPRRAARAAPRGVEGGRAVINVGIVGYGFAGRGFHNIADTLAGRAELAVRPEQVRRAMAVFAAAMDAARTGATISLGV